MLLKKKLVGKLRIICFINLLSKENKDLNSKKHKKIRIDQNELEIMKMEPMKKISSQTIS